MKMNKDQFFSALVRGKVKNFVYNGIKYYAKNNNKYFGGHDPNLKEIERGFNMSGSGKLLTSEFSNNNKKAIFSSIKGALLLYFRTKRKGYNSQGLLEKREFLYGEVGLTNYEGNYKHAVNWIDKAKYSDFDYEIKYKDGKYAENFYLRLIDKRKDWKYSRINIYFEGQFWNSNGFKVENATIRGDIIKFPLKPGTDETPLQFYYYGIERDLQSTTKELEKMWTELDFWYE